MYILIHTNTHTHWHVPVNEYKATSRCYTHARMSWGTYMEGK